MRADQRLLLWLLLTSTALEATPAEPAEDLAFLEFLALMIEDDEGWIDPLTARDTLPPAAEHQARRQPSKAQDYPPPADSNPSAPPPPTERAP
ncbi:MAG: hypothetical protein AAGG11_09215 [Pseudomonadota bacterium]